ncbi:GH10630 [Drosophila grimshawi]|uniref:GH10630 n=1 Tax=Drosophila grimshawi TaxID=7222 RepID=B4K2W9_DROGR|nr:GH10630 [Drosophila grimshawi]
MKPNEHVQEKNLYQKSRPAEVTLKTSNKKPGLSTQSSPSMKSIQPASKRSRKMRPLFLGNSMDIDECMSDKDAVLQQHIQQEHEQGQVQAAKVPTLFLPKVAQIHPLLD